MARTIKTKELGRVEFLNNIIFAALLIGFVSIAAVNVNIYVLAFLIILAPALLINVIWILIHTSSKKDNVNEINS
ncbi:MAG: hypothetical protein CMB56_006385 [Methanobacteriota archaeon]|nr:MAG: hypothetical protein CMB56_006385 [Euryarchaeota archaeon]|tara:strand:+ start:618 stop:842 length:225 start_codon:yes stop_codon:yes gene_type:complete